MSVAFSSLHSAIVVAAFLVRVGKREHPSGTAGKNPELEPIERAWQYLSAAHKRDLISMA